MSGRRLAVENTLLVVIDVQEKLTAVIHDRETLETNIDRLVRGCSLLGVPAVLTEQYPKGIGPTTEIVRRAFEETGGPQPIQKMCFSSQQCAGFAESLAAHGRKQILIAGIEAHVCVYQTVLDLLDAGYEVSVVADAVSSRTARNRKIALHRMTSEGAKLTSTEMALFELTVTSEGDQFKGISRLVK